MAPCRRGVRPRPAHGFGCERLARENGRRSLPLGVPGTSRPRSAVPPIPGRVATRCPSASRGRRAVRPRRRWSLQEPLGIATRSAPLRAAEKTAGEGEKEPFITTGDRSPCRGLCRAFANPGRQREFTPLDVGARSDRYWKRRRPHAKPQHAARSPSPFFRPGAGEPTRDGKKRSVVTRRRRSRMGARPTRGRVFAGPLSRRRSQEVKSRASGPRWPQVASGRKYMALTRRGGASSMLFAFGRVLYATRGLMTHTSEAELVSVLGHESAT